MILNSTKVTVLHFATDLSSFDVEAVVAAPPQLRAVVYYPNWQDVYTQE